MATAKHLTQSTNQGIEATNGCIATMWKTNFNMPMFDLSTGSCSYTNAFINTYYGNTTSMNLSGFTRGYEAILGVTIIGYCAINGDSFNGCGDFNMKWYDTTGSLIYANACDQRLTISLNPSPGFDQWQFYWYLGSLGTADWEINVNGNYCLKSCVNQVGGDDVNFIALTRTVAITNVPGAVSTGPTKGVIWVEGNNLNYRPSQATEPFEQSMAGTCVASGGTAGAIYIDTNHYLHWVNAGGCVFCAGWRICQFESWFSNSSGANPSPGASCKGAIWADGEFGFSHLAYIGCDGHKYITGAGECPHVAP